MPSCCGREFKDGSALEQHRLDKHNNMYGCRLCNRFFLSQGRLDQHNSNCHHPSSKHACGECRTTFVNNAALAAHLRSAAHAVEFRCCDCDKTFGSLQPLTQHLNDKTHKPKQPPKQPIKPVSSSITHECPECSRRFKSKEALRQHQTSSIHRPVPQFPCATSSGGQGCQSRFGSPSAMLQHLESGACHSGMDRHKLNLLVLAHDTARAISNPDSATQHLLREAARQLTEGSAQGIATPRTISWEAISARSTTATSSGSSSPVLTPTSGSLTPSPSLPPDLTLFRRNSGTLANCSAPSPGGGYRCPLCPSHRRAFATQTSLQQHLQSPAHSEPLFHCPISSAGAAKSLPVAKTSVQRFVTVSGLVQHVESGACGGERAEFEKALDDIRLRIGKLGPRAGRVIAC